MPELHAVQHQVLEIPFVSGKAYGNAAAEVELDVVFTEASGREWKVPAFWAGENGWRVRFAPQSTGKHRYRTICSDAANAGLSKQDGALTAAPYTGANPLLCHGNLRVSDDRRFLQHADGRPFFWLGDTWYMGLCARLKWPEEFRTLIADRLAKGFTTVQIVAGLYPDMPYGDRRGANEAGFPWEEDYSRLNPAYFDMADLRVAALVDAGLLPCLFGCWGYFLPWMGVEKLKQHWRNLIARYSAYPVVWCLAGEGAMPYYLSKNHERDKAAQIKGWTELARYVRAIDPYHHPVTIHPTFMNCSAAQLEDSSLLDINMLQCGHGGASQSGANAKHVNANLQKATMPLVNGEVCYEGIMEGSRQEVQRFLFWSTMLSGAAGHTYGANGIWQINRPDEPYGPSPHGASWGDTPWQDACRLPGSAQVGYGRKLLERYDWWKFQPHQDWVRPSAGSDDYLRPYAAGIPGVVRVLYFPTPICPWDANRPSILNFEPGSSYRAFWFDPCTGRDLPLGGVTPAPDNAWQVPTPALMQDWVLVLERK